ncbi:hypothetical protein Bra3105_12805 [Brachybacterium halotolerans subsp. kimchii]|uniref:hypothetical protein n=1 Tax=Brachybacterium halotolerans TaxID=2795215 RepID=UPI001E39AF1C|nr:hypothetical protein [Brachybacterium halotolerans]UEJ81718.1 hypothetical protein Bra3105_12805 [Brachybacterium halotolerans subsp. kimchii]
MQRFPHRLAAARRPVSVACALGAVLVLAAGCGGGDGADSGAAQTGTTQSDGGGSAAASGAGASDGSSASDGGSDGSGGSSGDSSTSAEPIAVTPPEQKPELTDACTGEGAFLVKGEKPNDPALPKRDDLTLKVSLEDVTDDDGADLVADIDGTQRPIETAHVGDTISVDQWTLSVTSVCKDSVEFDLID